MRALVAVLALALQVALVRADCSAPPVARGICVRFCVGLKYGGGAYTADA